MVFILGFVAGGVITGVIAILVYRKNVKGTEKIITDLKSRLNIS